MVWTAYASTTINGPFVGPAPAANDLVSSAPGTTTLGGPNSSDTAFGTIDQGWEYIYSNDIDGGSQSWSATLDINSFSGTVTVRFRLARYNSGGTLQSSSAWSGDITTTGDHTINPTWDSGTWSAGDRLILEVDYYRSGGHGNVNASFNIGSAGTQITVPGTAATTVLEQFAYRFRDHANANETLASTNWGVAQSTPLGAGNPARRFRLRVGVQETGGLSTSDQYKLQWNKNGGAWTDVAVNSPGNAPLRAAIDPVEIAENSGYTEQDPTSSSLLTGGSGGFVAGDGMDTTITSGSITLASQYTELEWSLWLHLYEDNMTAFWADGDTCNFRVVLSDNTPLDTYTANPSLTVDVASGYLAGQYIENPGNIGPFEASDGDLYVLMEPVEHNPVFTMMRSADAGVTWATVDFANRPTGDDLEGIDIFQVSDMLHIAQWGGIGGTDGVYYHRFNMATETWVETDTVIDNGGGGGLARRDQSVALAIKSNGDAVCLYHYDATNYKIGMRRRISGTWDTSTTIVWDSTNGAWTGVTGVLDPGTDIFYVFAHDDTTGGLYGKAILNSGTIQNLFADTETGTGTTVDADTGTSVEKEQNYVPPVFWNDGSPRIVIGWVSQTTADLEAAKITVGSGGSVGTAAFINDAEAVYVNQGFGRQPTATISRHSSGDLYAFWGQSTTNDASADNGVLYYAVSTDDAASWGTPATVSESAYGSHVPYVRSRPVTGGIGLFFHKASYYEQGDNNPVTNNADHGNAGGWNWYELLSLSESFSGSTTVSHGHSVTTTGQKNAEGATAGGGPTVWTPSIAQSGVLDDFGDYASGTVVTHTLSQTATAGNLLVVAHAWRDAEPTMVSSGYSKVLGTSALIVDDGIAIFCKVADGTETQIQVQDNDSAGDSISHWFELAGWSGTPTLVNQVEYNINETDETLDYAITTWPGDVVLAFGMARDDGGSQTTHNVTGAWSNGFVETADHSSREVSNANTSWLGAAYKQAQDSYETTTLTLSGSTDERLHGAVIVFRDSPTVLADDFTEPTITDRFVSLPADSDFLSTPHVAAYNVPTNGILDVRTDVALGSYTGTTVEWLVGKWTGTAANDSWAFGWNQNSENMRLTYRNDATTQTTHSGSSLTGVFSPGQRVQLRLRFDTAGGTDSVAFYYRTDGDITSDTGWTAGGTVSPAADTIQDTTTNVELVEQGGSQVPTNFYGALVKIDGTTVLDPDFTGALSLPYVDTQSRTWSPNGNAYLGAVALTEDFTGTNGADWDTTKWTEDHSSGTGNATIQSNRGEILQGTSNAARVVGASLLDSDTWDMKFRAQKGQTGSVFLAGMLWDEPSSNRWTTENPNDGYFLEYNSGTTYLAKETASVFTSLGSTAFDPSTTDYWWRLHYNSLSGFIAVKWWAVGSEEPDTWNLSATDTDHAGQAMRPFFVTANGDVTVDDVTITTRPGISTVFKASAAAGDGAAPATVTFPTGLLQRDDIVLVAGSLGSTLTTPVIGTDFGPTDGQFYTTLDNTGLFGTNKHGGLWFLQVRDTPPTTLTLEGSGSASDSVAYTIHVLRGGRIQQRIRSALQSSTATPNPDAVTVSQPGAAVYVASVGAVSSTLSSLSTGYGIEAEATQVDTNRANTAAGLKYLLPTGSEDPGVITWGNTGDWYAYTLDIVPLTPIDSTIWTEDSFHNNGGLIYLEDNRVYLTLESTAGGTGAGGRAYSNVKVKDAEVTGIVQTNNGQSGEDLDAVIVLRQYEGWNDGNDVPRNGYTLHFTRNSVNVAMYKTVEWTQTQIGSTQSRADNTSENWFRFRVEGNEIKAKWWTVGTTEPEAWGIEVTNDELGQAGYVGLSSWGVRTIRPFEWARQSYIDNLVVTDLSTQGPGINVVHYDDGKAGNGLSVTFPLPDSLQEDDVVVLVGGIGRDTTATDGTHVGTSTAGYTTLDFVSDDPSNIHMGVWYKRMGATPDTQVVGLGSGTAQDGAAYGVYVLRGIDTTTAVDAAPVRTGPVTDADPDSPSITTATDSALVISHYLTDSSNSWGSHDTGGPEPPGYSIPVWADQVETFSAKLGAAIRLKETIGAENPDAFDRSSTTVGDWYATTTAWRPAPAPSGGITHGHTVTVSGAPVTNDKTGSVTVSHGHSVTVSGQKGVEGTATVSHGHSVTVTGYKTGQDAAAVSHGHTVTTTGTKGAEGATTISHGHTVTITGSSLEAKSGSVTVSHGHSVTTTGAKGGEGTVATSGTSSATASGQKGAQDATTLSHPHSVTTDGTKGAEDVVAVSHGHTVTATGNALENKTGTASVSHGHSVTTTGQKGAEDATTISHPSSTTTTGSSGRLSSTSVSHPSAVTIDVSGGHLGAVTASHGHTVSITGTAAGEGQGSTAVSHGHTVSVTGQKAGAGTSSVSHGHTVTVTGDAAAYNFSGTTTVTHGHTVAVSGQKGGAGSVVESVVASVTAVLLKGAFGSTTVSHGHTVTIFGNSGNYNFTGTVTVTATAVVYSEGGFLPAWDAPGFFYQDLVRRGYHPTEAFRILRNQLAKKDAYRRRRHRKPRGPGQALF